MADELIQVQLAYPDRKFVKVYHDFLMCELLTTTEKMVYISLKSFLNFADIEGEVFPTIDILCQRTSLDRKTVIQAIKSLESKHIIKKKRQGLNKPNLYTLTDKPSMWRAESEEELSTIADSTIDLTTDELIEELKRRGVVIEAKKELSSDTDQSTDESSTDCKYSFNQNTTESTDNQYTFEYLSKIYNYSTIVKIAPQYQEDIEAVLNIIVKNVFDTTARTVRIGKEDKPRLAVMSVFLKLTGDDLLYVIETFHKQTERIRSKKNYILTMLYHAKEDNHFDWQNLGHSNGDF